MVEVKKERIHALEERSKETSLHSATRTFVLDFLRTFFSGTRLRNSINAVCSKKTTAHVWVFFTRRQKSLFFWTLKKKAFRPVWSGQLSYIQIYSFTPQGTKSIGNTGALSHLFNLKFRVVFFCRGNWERVQNTNFVILERTRFSKSFFKVTYQHPFCVFFPLFSRVFLPSPFFSHCPPYT